MSVPAWARGQAEWATQRPHEAEVYRVLTPGFVPPSTLVVSVVVRGPGGERFYDAVQLRNDFDMDVDVKVEPGAPVAIRWSELGPLFYVAEYRYKTTGC